MKSGQLDRRVTIERMEEGVDKYGDPIPGAWVPVCTVWCAFEPLVGREFMAALQAQSEVSARVRLRYRPGITSADRVRHDGKVYGIDSVIHVKSARQELQLLVRG
ncbi:phage head closure protein [Simplicispira psychrophila]|uniref:phage head closure protein n=1 Tax=Simplicispira psychrophila TaxID=80882 RepID=UPI000483C9C3|nr:phage head closure protein [Simplicispira psychrophila]